MLFCMKNFMCEINNFVIFTVVLLQQEYHILPQSIKENVMFREHQ